MAELSILSTEVEEEQDYPLVGTRGEAPGEPIINPDGSQSSERTISFEKDGQEYLIPTIVPDEEGFLVKHSNEDAIALHNQGTNPEVGVFDTPEEATEFAKQRSEGGGRFQTTAPKPLTLVSEERDTSPARITIGSVESEGFFSRAFDAFQDWRQSLKPERKFTREEAQEITKQNIKLNRELFPNQGGVFGFGEARPAPHSALVRAGLAEPPQEEAEVALTDALRGDPEIKSAAPRVPSMPAGKMPSFEPGEGPKEDPWGTVIWDTLTNVPAMFKRQYAGAKMFLNAPRDLAYLLEAAADEGVAPEDSFAVEVEAYVKGQDPADYYKNMLDQAAADADLQEGMAMREEAQNYLRDFAPKVREDSAKYYASAIIEGTINMAPALVTAAVTRSPSMGAALMGGQVFADQYAESIASGRSHSQATMDGIVFAAAETITERIPLGILTKEGGTLLKRLLKSGGAEGIQEPITQLIQEAYTKGIVNDEMTFGEAIVEITTTKEGLQMLKRSAIIGVGVGGTLAGMAHPLYRGVTEEDVKPPPVDKTKKPNKPLTPAETAGEISDTEAAQLGLSKVAVTQDLLERAGSGDPLTLDEQYTLTNDGWGRFIGQEDHIMLLPKSRRKLAKMRKEAIEAGERVEEVTMEGEEVTTRITEAGEVVEEAAEIEVVDRERPEFRRLIKEEDAAKEAVTKAKNEFQDYVDEVEGSENVDQEHPTVKALDAARAALSEATARIDEYVTEPTVRARLREREDEAYARREPKPERLQRQPVRLYAGEQVNRKEHDIDRINVPERLKEIVGPLPELQTHPRATRPTAAKRMVKNEWARDVRQRLRQAFPSITDIALETAFEEGAGIEGMFVNITKKLAKLTSIQNINGMLEAVDKLVEKYDMVEGVGPPVVVAEEDDISEGEVFTSEEPLSRRATAERLDAVSRRIEPPTEAQKKAGNYKKGHMRIDSLPITVETAKGQTRTGVDAEGKKWSMRMKDAYGYIKGTESREEDGRGGFDQIDAFIGRYPESGHVVIVNQKKDAAEEMSVENFDEHKVMIGYRTTEEAIKAYRRNYEDGGKLLGNYAEMTTADFRKWLNRVDTRYPAGMDKVDVQNEKIRSHRRMKTNSGLGKPVAQVQAALRPVYRAFRTVPPVRVVESIEDLPRHLQIALEDDHSRKNTTGMYDQGAFKDDIYIIANNVTDTREAIETMLHEVIGHFGLRQVIAPWKFDETMDMVAKSFPKEVREITRNYDLDWNIIDERRIAAEEYIAHTAQRVLVGQTVSDKAKALLDRIVQALRDAVRWATGKDTLFNSGEIMSMIAQSSDFVQTPGGYQRTKRRGRLRHVSAPYFFSQVWTAFNETDTKSTSADGWKQFVKSQLKKGKMKQAELDWLGLDTWLDDVTWGSMYQMVANTGWPVGDRMEDVEALFPGPIFEIFKEQRELGAENTATIKRAQELQYEAFDTEYPDVAKKIGAPEFNRTASDFRTQWLKDNEMTQFLPVNEQRDLANNQDRYRELTRKLEAFGETKPKKIPINAIQSYIERNGVDIDVRNPGADDEYGEPYFEETYPDSEEEPDEDQWYDEWQNFTEGYWSEYYDRELVRVYEEHGWAPDLEADPDIPEEEDMDIEELNEALGAWDGTSVDDMEMQATEQTTESIEEDYYQETRDEWEKKNREATWYSGQYSVRIDSDGDFSLDHDEDGNLGYSQDFDTINEMAQDHYENKTAAWASYMLKPAGEGYEVLLFRWQNPDKSIFEESGHWENEDNFVAHVRFDIRKDPDGNDAFYIDEMQSDWHQAIRDAVKQTQLEVWADHGYFPDHDNGDGTFGGGDNYDGTPVPQMYEEARAKALENPEEVKKWMEKAKSQWKAIDGYKARTTEEMKSWPMNKDMATQIRSMLVGETGVAVGNAKDLLTRFGSTVDSKEGGAISTEETRREQIRAPIYEEHGFVAGLSEQQNIIFAAYRELMRAESGEQLKADLISKLEFNEMVEKRAIELGVHKRRVGTTEQITPSLEGWASWADDIWTHSATSDHSEARVANRDLSKPAIELPDWDGTPLAKMEGDVVTQAREQLHDEAMTRPLKDLPSSVNEWQQVQDGTHFQEAWDVIVDNLARDAHGWESHKAVDLYSAWTSLARKMSEVSMLSMNKALELVDLPAEEAAEKAEAELGFKPFEYAIKTTQVANMEHAILSFHESKNKYAQHADGQSFAPFEKDWQMLVLKHMIAEATRRGMSRIYFSKGEVHGLRWSGAEAVEQVHFKKNPLPEIEQDPTPDMFTGELRQPKRGDEFSMTLQVGDRFIETTNKQLSKNVGQRAAKLILESKQSEGTIHHSDVGQRNIIVPTQSGGERLTGSRVIYNEVAVNQINKFLKKFKGKVKETWVPGVLSNLGPMNYEAREQIERQGLATKGMPGPDYNRWQQARIRRLSGVEVATKVDGGFDSHVYKSGESIADPAYKGVWMVEVPDENGLFQKASDFFAGREQVTAKLFDLQRMRGDKSFGYEAWEIEITPKLAETARTGFPLFHKRPKPGTGDPGLDNALDWANKNIGAQGPRSIERLQEFINSVIRIPEKQAKAEQAFLDQFAGLKWAIRQTHDHELPAQINAYKQAHFTTSMDSQMFVFLTHGIPEWQTVATAQGTGTITGIKPGTKGLLEVLEPVTNNIKEWGYWMAARRANRLLKEGREALFTQERVDELLKLGDMFPEFQDVADGYNDWKSQFLDWAQEAGVINSETRPLWDQADYVPFFRIKSDDMGGSFAQRAGIGGPGIANVTQPIKRLIGSKHPLGDILENIIVNFQHIAMTTMKNKAAQLAIENLQDTNLITKVPPQEFMKQEFIPMDELKKKLKQAGVDWEAMPTKALEGMQKMWTLQRPLGDDVISVLYDGKKKYFKVHEETLLRSMTAINEKKFASIWGRMGMWLPRKFKRLGTSMITLTPGFMAANWFRDLFMAFTNSRHARMPKPFSGMTGAWKAFTKSPEMVSMMAAGGAFYSGYINANDPVSTVKAMKRALRQTGFKNRILDAPWKLFHFYNDIGAASENANRIGSAYIPAIKAGAGKAEAIWESKDLMNFAKHGDHAAMQFFAQTVMFLNARIQGLVRYGQRFKEAPGITFAKSMMYSMAVLAIWLKNKDDDRYKALPEEEKDMYIHFWVNGKHWRLPKAFEVGMVFGVGVERMFEYFYSNEDDAGKVAIDRLWFVFGEVFNFFNRETVVPLPQFIGPLFEATNNWNAFFQAPIVPEYMQDIAEVKPEIVFRPQTSPTARELARGMPKFAPATLRNPLLLEHLVRGYLGTLGGYVMMMSDDLVRKQFDYPPRPALRWNKIPLAGRFYRGDEPPSRSNFEEIMYEVRNNARQIERAVSQMERLEMEDEVDEFLEAGSKYDPNFTNQEVLDAADAMESSYKQIRDLRKEANALWEDPDMTPEEKLRELNNIYRDKLDLSKDAWMERPGALIQFEALQDTLIDMIPEEREGFLVEQGLEGTADLLASIPKKPTNRMKRIMWENSA